MNNPKEENEEQEWITTLNRRQYEELYKQVARDVDRDTAARMVEIDKKLFGEVDNSKKHN